MTSIDIAPAAPLLAVDRLAVSVAVKGELRPVITDVSFELARGESIGLVGESGSGKSMTVRTVLRLLSRSSVVTGSIAFEGEDVYAMSPARLRAWRAREVGMIYQDPRAHINPMRKVGDFLTEGLRNQGVSRAEAEQRAEALLQRVGVRNAGDRMHQYPHQLSGGLLQRVMIASVLLMKPKLVVADEPTTALDVTVQESVMAILDEMRRDEGVSLVMITHDLDLAAAVTDRLAVVYAGRVVEVGDSDRIHTDRLHPYTAGLLDSRPSLELRERPRAIPGRPVAAFEAPSGCVFSDRCAAVTSACRSERPDLRLIGHQSVACVRGHEFASPTLVGLSA